jgi:HSP20 family protein
MLLRRISDWPEWDPRDPFRELERIRRQMDWLSDSLSGRLSREPAAGVFPFVNVTEDKDHYYVRAELPGIKADDLKISVTGNTLSVSGERKTATQNENARYHRREREAGRFSRVIALPSQIDTGKVEARSADGVLTVVLPKPEEVKPRQITVKTL